MNFIIIKFLLISILIHGAIFIFPGFLKLKEMNVLKKQKKIIHINTIIINEYKKISDENSLQKVNGIKPCNDYLKESLITYRELLRALIYKAIHYPVKAKNSKMEGEAVINFTLNQNGKLLDYRISKSTGFIQLDNEVEKAVKRIKKFPSFPDFIQQKIVKFSLSINFKLKG